MEKQSVWYKLYPITKMWLALAIIILVFTATNYVVSAIVFVFFTAVIVKLKITNHFKFILFSMFLLGFSMFTVQGLLSAKNETALFMIAGIEWLTFYKEGLLYAADLYCRILPLAPCIYLVVKTTNITDLGVALNMSGVTYKFTYILVSTFQVIPVLQKEMVQITNAQRARGLVTEGNLIHRFKAFVPIIVPLIANSISKVQSKAIALESKGFNAPVTKTYYRQLKKTGVDTAINVISVVLGVSGVVYRVALVARWI